MLKVSNKKKLAEVVSVEILFFWLKFWGWKKKVAHKTSHSICFSNFQSKKSFLWWWENLASS